jgi:hypothetical protein
MCREAPRAVLELESYGLPFSRTETGQSPFLLPAPPQDHLIYPQAEFINEPSVVSLSNSAKVAKLCAVPLLLIVLVTRCSTLCTADPWPSTPLTSSSTLHWI